MNNEPVIGVDLGGTNIRVGIVENRKIVEEFSDTISSDASEEIVLKEVINSIERIFNNNVVGIGIGVPSVVDVEEGIVYDVQNIHSWKKVYLKNILENEFNVNVRINNDVNCFVLGEKIFGKAKKYKNIIGLASGTGLGGGIIIKNDLYHGIYSGAGEFGLIPFKGKNFEYYCSRQIFISEFGKKGEEIFNLAGKGDTDSLEIYEELGKNFGELIKNHYLLICT